MSSRAQGGRRQGGPDDPVRAARGAHRRDRSVPGGAFMTNLSGKIAIAGVHEHETRWAPEKTETQIMAESARGALADCGLSLSDVDALFAASMSMGPMGVVKSTSLATRRCSSTSSWVLTTWPKDPSSSGVMVGRNF